MLLEAIVPSRARRELLGAVLAGGGLTVRQLARAARVPYSAAHRELERLAEAGLVRRRREGRAWICRWNPELPGARALASLLQAPGNSPSDAAVIANLKRWGAPLAEDVGSARHLSLEETLAQGVSLARRRPDVAQTWPIVLSRHAAGADLERLAALARRRGERRALGFLLALTAHLSKNSRIAAAAGRLRDRRVRAVEDFFVGPRESRVAALAARRTPLLARRWSFRMNTSLEGFESHFRKFRGDR